MPSPFREHRPKAFFRRRLFARPNSLYANLVSADDSLLCESLLDVSILAAARIASRWFSARLSFSNKYTCEQIITRVETFFICINQHSLNQPFPGEHFLHLFLLIFYLGFKWMCLESNERMSRRELGPWTPCPSKNCPPFWLLASILLTNFFYIHLYWYQL